MKIALTLSLLITIASYILFVLYSRVGSSLNIANAAADGGIPIKEIKPILESSSANAAYADYVIMGMIVLSSFMTGWIIKLLRGKKIAAKQDQAQQDMVADRDNVSNSLRSGRTARGRLHY